MHHARNDLNWLFLYEHAGLSIILVYGIDFNHPRTLLKYVLLETQSILKHFFTLFNMNSRSICGILCFIILKKDEICTIYGNDTTTITIIRN